MVNLSLNGIGNSIESAFSTFVNFLANILAIPSIIAMVILFFAIVIGTFWVYAKVINFLVKVAVPFVMRFGLVIDSFEKFKELTSFGLFNDRKSSNNRSDEPNSRDRTESN